MELCIAKTELRRRIKVIEKEIKSLNRLIKKQKACVVVVNSKLITVY